MKYAIVYEFETDPENFLEVHEIINREIHEQWDREGRPEIKTTYCTNEIAEQVGEAIRPTTEGD